MVYKYPGTAISPQRATQTAQDAYNAKRAGAMAHPLIIIKSVNIMLDSKNKTNYNKSVVKCVVCTIRTIHTMQERK